MSTSSERQARPSSGSPSRWEAQGLSPRGSHTDDSYLHPFLGLLVAGIVYVSARLLALFQREGEDRIRPQIKSIVGRWRRPRLGLLYQHYPVQLRVPDFYYKTKSGPSPPGISLVTPSLNQGRFLRAACESVLSQKYPRLEYIVRDGKSTDESCSLLRTLEDRIAAVRIAEDGGQAHALNLGFAESTGEIMAWLNADDILLPGSLDYVAAFFSQHPDIDLIYGHRVLIDELGREIGRWVLPPFDGEMLRWTDYVPQETMFWRRSLWEKSGAALDEKFTYALDWELLLRFMKHGARIRRVPRFLAGFRVHALQKTQANASTSGAAEIALLLEGLHGRKVSHEEVSSRIKLYFARSTIYDALYRLGVLRA
jgi:glycosyltransferase involved in cell wall biosynthesis